MAIMEFRIRFPLYAEFRYLKRIVLEELPCVNLLFRLRGYRNPEFLQAAVKKARIKAIAIIFFIFR